MSEEKIGAAPGFPLAAGEDDPRRFRAFHLKLDGFAPERPAFESLLAGS